jgi:predicted phage terminase large subunit-like protein
MRNLYNSCDLPKDLTRYTGFDLAVSKDSKKRDATCCLTAGLDEEDVLWLVPEIYWEKKAADQTVEFIGAQLEYHNPMTVYCEKGQLDKAIGPFLEKYLIERKIYKYFEKMPTAVNKGARATSIRGRIEHNKVKFPKDAPGWPAAVDQMLKFTGSGDDKEDDFVDALAMIGQGLHRQYHVGHSAPEKNIDLENHRLTLGWIKKDSNYRKQQHQYGKNNSSW